jgi:glycosyltransferase involved in cell wall biosynthesis
VINALDALTSHHPFFSNLTASYNRGETLQSTLRSLRDQSFRDFEHIVIDGGSQDQSLRVLEEFEGTYSLRWISEPDRGIAHALNKGLHLSRGKYIVVIQSDDQLYDADTLLKVFQQAHHEAFDILSFPVIYNELDGNKVLHAPIRLLWWNRFKFIFRHQGIFVHQRVFRHIGGFDERFSIAMDYDFLYRAIGARFTVNFGMTPVALMGPDGIGSSPRTLLKRLSEEALVQDLNERNPFWRMAQTVFSVFYVPYKTRFVPLMNALRGMRDNRKVLRDR